jgi:RNA polymerase sigma-70 factor (ECF subfamily)
MPETGEDRAAVQEEIQGAVEGDPASWQALVSRHRQAVFRLAYLILGNAFDAEDIAQEAFLKAYQALHRFDRQRPLRPWLLRIARNLAYNRLRSKKRQNGLFVRLLRQQSPQPFAGRELEQSSQTESVWSGIHSLSRQDQEVIFMRYFLEMGEGEMADSLDVARGTVKSRLHRALNRLQGVLIRQAHGTRMDGT